VDLSPTGVQVQNSSTTTLTDVLANTAKKYSEKSEHEKLATTIERKLECGPMPNVMAALPNIGGTLCSTLQSLADAQYWSAEQ